MSSQFKKKLIWPRNSCLSQEVILRLKSPSPGCGKTVPEATPNQTPASCIQ